MQAPYRHIAGVFPSEFVRRENGWISQRYGRCPRCGKTRRGVIAHKTVDGELLPFRWLKRWLRCRLGCTRCRITWDVYTYSHFKLLQAGLRVGE